MLRCHISHTTNILLFEFRCNIFIGVRIIKEKPDSVATGTSCIKSACILSFAFTPTITRICPLWECVCFERWVVSVDNFLPYFLFFPRVVTLQSYIIVSRYATSHHITYYWQSVEYACTNSIHIILRMCLVTFLIYTVAFWSNHNYMSSEIINSV
jgi:hypothetical protein